MQFLRIAVALDGSENSNKVFNVAVSLVKLSRGKLIIIHAIATPVPSGGLFYSDSVGMEKLRSELDEAGMRLLEHYSQRAKNEHKVEVETVLARGHASEIIVKEASAHGADLIVVGSKGFSGAKQFFIGSVPNSVLHQSSIPVLLVK